jgi:hypothetical protein
MEKRKLYPSRESNPGHAVLFKLPQLSLTVIMVVRLVLEAIWCSIEQTDSRLDWPVQARREITISGAKKVTSALLHTERSIIGVQKPKFITVQHLIKFYFCVKRKDSGIFADSLNNKNNKLVSNLRNTWFDFKGNNRKR